ncbi:MAG: DNA alkylation repair protein [Methanomicrobiales archaeon]|nr:DNA alkylation repair protein [Methanomicrobiales archaeon]
MHDEIISSVRKELKQHVDRDTRVNYHRFFKEDVLCYGVRAAEVRRISREHFRQMKGMGKTLIFSLCETSLASDYCEEAFIASDWVYRLRKEYEPGDLALFERWIGEYIDNWAKCDTFCNHALGAFVERFPSSIENLKGWTRSGNRWFRRAAAVTLILPARKGMFLPEILEIADLLLGDEDDLVQKGCGWLLKEASRTHAREVFEYVMARKREMPRTMLRYAIEKMPGDWKRQAMER